MAREELGIAPGFVWQLKDEIRILRRRVALRGDWILGYPHRGGYVLLRKVAQLPAD